MDFSSLLSTIGQNAMKPETWQAVGGAMSNFRNPAGMAQANQMLDQKRYWDGIRAQMGPQMQRGAVGQGPISPGLLGSQQQQLPMMSILGQAPQQDQLYGGIMGQPPMTQQAQGQPQQQQILGLLGKDGQANTAPVSLGALPQGEGAPMDNMPQGNPEISQLLQNARMMIGAGAADPETARQGMKLYTDVLSGLADHREQLRRESMNKWEPSTYDLEGFGKLPMLVNKSTGEMKPIEGALSALGMVHEDSRFNRQLSQQDSQFNREYKYKEDQAIKDATYHEREFGQKDRQIGLQERQISQEDARNSWQKQYQQAQLDLQKGNLELSAQKIAEMQQQQAQRNAWKDPANQQKMKMREKIAMDTIDQKRADIYSTQPNSTMSTTLKTLQDMYALQHGQYQTADGRTIGYKPGLTPDPANFEGRELWERLSGQLSAQATSAMNQGQGTISDSERKIYDKITKLDKYSNPDFVENVLNESMNQIQYIQGNYEAKSAWIKNGLDPVEWNDASVNLSGYTPLGGVAFPDGSHALQMSGPDGKTYYFSKGKLFSAASAGDSKKKAQ